VLVTFPDFDADDPAVGGVITAAGLELRMAPKFGPRSTAELARLLSGVVGAIVSTDPFTADVLRGAPALRVIARTGVGYDTIDMAVATELGIQVVTTPGANENAVADHALGLLLALLRRIPELDTDARAGGWSRTGAHLPRQLAGCTVGVVGYGGIGRQVAKRLAGFGVELLVHDPVLGDDGPVASTPFDELLARSDVVTLHCPLLPETRGLIDVRALSLMQPHAVLVNTSRGPVVDEPALVAALQSGRIAGAALDVFLEEPPVGSPLLSMPNVVVSPHNGGLSDVSIAEMTRRCAEAVVAVARGGVAADLVNRRSLATHPDPTIRQRFLPDRFLPEGSTT
jgi:phosphoglycerate dehydrogenase-like enzyme